MTAKNDRHWRLKPSSEPSVLSARLRLNARRGHHREALKDLAWQVADREAFFRRLLEAQEDIVWCEDADGTIAYANPAFQRMLGVDAGNLAPPKRRARKSIHESSQDSRVMRALEEIETVAGWRWYEVLRHRDPANGFTQCVGRDASERVAYQRQIEEARDAANAANRAKSRFLAAMSHEIRTPMNGVLGMAALLAETPLEPEQRTYLSAMDRSGRTLLYLIDEILDFSKIEAGRLELDEQPMLLEDCAQSVMELLSPRAREKGISLVWAIDPRLPQRMIGDDVRLRQILTNLISNALKFTDSGGVLVTIESDRRRQPRGEAGQDRTRAKAHSVVISVLDTGTGINPEALNRLFDEFEQGEEGRHRHHGGTGLGLAITRRLARAMGGDVFARSKPGEGSTFTVVLRLRSAPEGNAAAHALTAEPDGSGAHILQILPSAVERLATRLTLEGSDAAVVDCTLANADALISQATADEVPFSGLIVDSATSPVAAGAMLARARAAGAVRGVVLLNPNERGLFSSYAAVGFDVSLLRPHRPKALIDAVMATGSARHSGPHVVRTAVFEAPPAERQPCVLLVEDNDINALLAERTLEKLGCTVVAVTNGSAAVMAMDRHLAGDAHYDLVLMDVHMPVMDGLEAARVITAKFAAAGTKIVCPPIVALTANAFEEDRKRCLDSGMSGFLTKPFEREALQGLLDQLATGSG